MVKKTVTITTTYSPEEVAIILREHLNLPKDALVEFKLEGKNDPTDWRGEYPPTYELGSVVISYKEEA